MSSRDSTPFDIGSIGSQASAAALVSTLPSAFGRMMHTNRATAAPPKQDLCRRPTPTYNDNYNPYQVPSKDPDENYSPYVWGEPLYDDRLVQHLMLPVQHTLAGASKRKKT